MSLSNLANASNERREQNMMRLKVAFNKGEIATVMSACHLFGYSETTIRRWCKDADVPLYDTSRNEYVVPVTKENVPRWVE